MNSGQDIQGYIGEKAELQVDAFKKIYAALRAGQDNKDMVKSNFLKGKEKMTNAELYHQIIQHRGNDNRTSQAWDLAKRYYGGSCNPFNKDLIDEILKHSTNNSRYFGWNYFGLLNNSNPQQIEQKNEVIRKRIEDVLAEGFTLIATAQKKSS